MANIAVTYTFSNSTTADATQVNQNFQDIIDGLSNGTKDISISGLTVAGNASFNGDTTLGNASGDTITFTGTADFGSNLATQADQETGSSTSKIVSPGRQQYHASAAKAWVIYTSVTTTAIGTSYNVSSLTDGGVGITTINFTTAFSSASYAHPAASFDNGAGVGLGVGFNGTPATGSLSCITFTPSTIALADSARVSVAIFGDQ